MDTVVYNNILGMSWDLSVFSPVIDSDEYAVGNIFFIGECHLNDDNHWSHFDNNEESV